MLLVGGYAVTANWAMRHGGPARLGFVAAGTLLLVSLATMLLGIHYGVPSMPRLLQFVLVLTGPVVLVPTVVLWWRAKRGTTRNATLGIALLGALAGLFCGWVLVVYVIGFW